MSMEAIFAPASKAADASFENSNAQAVPASLMEQLDVAVDGLNTMFGLA